MSVWIVVAVLGVVTIVIKAAGPVLLGPGCEIGEDVRIDGPAVIGDGAKIGAGSRLRDVIVLPGAELAPQSVLIGAILGTRRS